MDRKRRISQTRARVLKESIVPYLEASGHIQKGRDEECMKRYEQRKRALLKDLNATMADWDNWHWQLGNRIEDLDVLASYITLSDEQYQEISEVSELYRWAVTPYYLALIDPDDPEDPIRKQCIPTGLEMDMTGESDPMCEEFTSPAGNITRRYPDRLILNVTNACAMFCRHCQRRRRIGSFDTASTRAVLDESIDYIRQNPEIRDVLITGGDPLTLSNSQLDYIISAVRSIPSVEIIRLGTRTLVTMPQRFDNELLEILERNHPIYLNTHFNHPRELTPEAAKAAAHLAKAGVPMGNQMVLLGGINDDKFIVEKLNHELLMARIRPYYIFHAKLVKGTLHFRTSIDKGLEIMEHLRGRTSGMAIPTYILNAPGGLGKIPLLPEYIIERTDESVTLRTWEGKLVQYPNNISSESSLVRLQHEDV